MTIRSTALKIPTVVQPTDSFCTQGDCRYNTTPYNLFYPDIDIGVPECCHSHCNAEMWTNAISEKLGYMVLKEKQRGQKTCSYSYVKSDVKSPLLLSLHWVHWISVWSQACFGSRGGKYDIQTSPMDSADAARWSSRWRRNAGRTDIWMPGVLNAITAPNHNASYNKSKNPESWSWKGEHVRSVDTLFETRQGPALEPRVATSLHRESADSRNPRHHRLSAKIPTSLTK